MKKNLLIIGGGYAGIALIKGLKQSFNITLIDENQFHIHQTEIHKFLSDNIKLEELTFSYEEFAIKNSFNFIQEHVDSIDFEKNKVFCNTKTLDYDYIVLATGSKTFFPKQIKNLDFFKKDIKSLDVIKQFKNDFFNLINSNKVNQNIVIAGGGLSGVEIAIELAEKIKEKNLSAKEIKVTIVEQQKTILPGADDYLINKTKKVLDKFNIECVHGEFITEVCEDKIILSNKTEIPYNLSLFVLGVSSEKIDNRQNIDFNVKNQYVVNEYFQIENSKNAFCIGDFAQTLTPTGEYNLPTAQMANMQAKILAKNLKNLIYKKEFEKKEIKLKGVLIDLGKNNAVGAISNLKLSAYVAYILKRFTSNLHKLKFN